MTKQSGQAIVVGLDGTASSAAALRWAAQRAHELDTNLRIVHAWQLSPEESLLGGATLRQVRAADERVKATRWAVDALGTAAHRPRRKLEVLEGPAGRVLVETATDAAMLVVGTQEHIGLKRLTSGSVSHYCVTHSPRPVVAVPVNEIAELEDDPAERIDHDGRRPDVLTAS
jgi:nucleotide-binding universal stress UspA family protein